jgi:uncharacterized protein (DUF486 family)
MSLIFTITLLIQSSVFASDSLTGNWKHSNKPAVISFDLESGIASIKTHKLHTEAEGLTLIKDISKHASIQQQWVGNMFNGYVGIFEPVTIRYLKTTEIAVYNLKNEEVLRLVRE